MRVNLNFQSIAVRLALSFGVILALFAATLLITLQTLDEVEQAERKLGHLDHAKHMGHNAVNLVREAYIHQAHTLIDWDDTHVGPYLEAMAAARDLIRHLSRLDLSGANSIRAAKLATLAGSIDDEFRGQILPRIKTQPRSSVSELHGRVQVMVEEVIGLNEHLNRDLEEESADARRTAEANRANARSMVIACWVLASLLAAIVAFLLVRAILRPVGQLKEAAESVAEGDLDARIEVVGQNEFSQLGRSFNRMVQDLKKHQTELLHSHRLASVGQLAAGVAHEINNPLGVILGYAKLLKRSAPEGMKSELQIIEDEAIQCKMIVSDLLELARPDALVNDDFDLVALIQECVENITHSGDFAGREIAVHQRGESHVIQGDRSRLRQVVLNLLTNALQSSESALVEVRLTGVDGGLMFVVSDTGVGMPPEVQKRVTEPFFTTKDTGTGLGLAISQNIIDAHGGRMDFESFPRRGTKASVWLPGARGTGGQS